MRPLNPILASIAIHLLGALVLLMTWSAPEVTSQRISTYLLAASAESPKETQASTKVSRSTLGSSRPKATPKQSQASTTPTMRNGLLRPKEAAPGALAAPKAIDFFAKATEFKRRDPDLREDKHEDYGWTSEIKRDGKVEFTDKPLIEPPSIVVDEDGFKIRLRVPDINELIMRLRGDPMYDPQKRKYLKNTKEIRVTKAAEFTREKLTQSLNDLGDRLTTLWFDNTLSATIKRQRLFDMWEECAEEGSDTVLTMSELVRVSIKFFIRRNMPKGTELAYTEDDLIRLNKDRKSKAEFNPYG